MKTINMKTKNETFFLSMKTAFADYMIHDRLISLNNSVELLALFRKLGWRLLSASIPRIEKSTNRLSQLYNFGKYVLRMRKHHGELTTIKYLKACQLSIQKAISRDRIKSLRDLEPDLPLPRLTKTSLPRYIPLGDRRAILSGSPSVIRWWLTLYSVYRILQAPGKLKLETITQPFTGDSDLLARASMELKVVALSFKKFAPKEMKPGVVKLLETASPSFKVSWVGFIHDYISLGIYGLDSPLKIILKASNSESLLRLIDTVETLIQVTSLVDIYTRTSVGTSFFKWTAKQGGQIMDACQIGRGKIILSPIGQLSTKTEAAGKVRVFAMVDIWTQWALRPLHQYLFSFLRSLPNDGTFDQHASVKRCMVKSRVAGKSFGYDLSAATDRLPISLQVDILSVWFGPEFSQAWAKLLVGRDYILKPQKPDNIWRALKYSVGQPMGALSSWGMLAVTHHFLVQISALRAGKTRPGNWFEGYELLGDDINIFDEEVAYQYLALMASIGVPINTSKSVVATNASFEFAKVTGHHGQNVSAISWKMFLSQNTMMGRVNIVFSLLNKDMAIPTLGRWINNITSKTWFQLGNPTYSYVSLLSMFAKSGKFSYESLISALTVKSASGRPLKRSYKNFMKGQLTSSLMTYIGAIVAGKIPQVSKIASVSFETNYFRNQIWEMLVGKLNELKFDKACDELAQQIIQCAIDVYPTGKSPLDYMEEPYDWKGDRSGMCQTLTLLFVNLSLALKLELTEDVSKLMLATAKVTPLKEDGTPKMLMKRGEGLVPYPPVMPTYYHDIAYWIDLSNQWDRFMEVLDTPTRAFEKLARPDLPRQRRDPPLKAFKLFFKYATGKPNFSAYRVVEVRQKSGHLSPIIIEDMD